MLPTVEEFFSHRPAIVVFTWNMLVDKGIIDLAKKYNIPIYRTSESTSEFMAGITHTLSIALAKRITRHGVFVEVYGEGVLLYGESGVGKSEVAMELIKRGHRLIADDAWKSAAFQSVPSWALRRKISATLWSFAAWV